MTLPTILQHLVTLAGHIAWPMTAISILIIVRKELLAIFSALSNKIADPKTSIVFGMDSIGLLNATVGKVESLESNQKQTADLLMFSQAQKMTAVAPNGQESLVKTSGLEKLADAYLKISVSDWRERVRLKDEYASKMGNLVIANRISRDWLADQEHQGMLMALISAIHLLPDQKDFDRLSRIANKISKLHIRYRVAMAIGHLFEQNLIKQNEIDIAKNILHQYETDADAPLKRRIEQTRAIMEYRFAANKNHS